MLDLYSEEIDVLSIKHIDAEVRNAALIKIREKLPTSEKKRREILKFATATLLNNVRNRDYNASFGMLRFTFFTNLEKPIAEARKQGVFRASKTNFNPKLTKELLEELYHSQTLADDELHYIRSVNGLLKLAPDVLDFKNKIVVAASSRRYFLKTILSIAETKYSDLLAHYDERPEIPYMDMLFHNNKESILTSASYIVQIYREVTPGLKLKDSNGIDETISHDFYYNLLEAAFSITNYLEAEIKVDFYDYGVWFDEETRSFSVDSVEFETAKSYGYAKADLRMYSQSLIYNEAANSKSYAEMLNEFWLRDSQEAESIVHAIKNAPFERIVLKTFNIEYGHQANIFGHDRPFKEEQMQLMALMDENYNIDVFDTKIYRDFACFDIFKLQRFFGFIAFIYKKAYEKLRAEGHSNSDLIRKRSVLPVFDKEDLVRIFQNTTGKSQADCEGLLEKLTNDKFTDYEVIDLQYKPILTIEHRYLVMPTLFAYSNLCRSLAIDEGVHFSVSGKYDYMVKNVSDILNDQGFTVQHDFPFGDDEIDIAAVYGENLFLFECKNPYHPVNDFELRNTYAHLVKGFSQIEKFQERFKDRQVLDQFLKNLKVNPKNIKNIHYGVINANRALTGLSKNGVKVFHANELMNFISTGKLISADCEYHSWKSESFHGEDLVAYMTGEVISDDMICHKLPLPFSIAFRSGTMHFRTYQYDLEKTNALIETKYRYIGQHK